jgi:hypothetical protein
MSKLKKSLDSPASPSWTDSTFVPRWRWLVALLAVATLSLGYQVFAGRFLVNPHSDQYIAGYGFREFAAESLRSGHGFPQWNPYLFGGLPYIAAMHGDIFYPTFLLRMILRTDLAMTWGFIIHLFLAGAFTLGFLRALRIRAWAAGFGALAYMMSGSIASYASPGHDGKLFVSALLPLGLWMLVRAIRDDRRWAWGMFALTVGLAVLSPHPQLLQFMLLVSGCFALFLVWQHGLGEDRDAVRSPTDSHASPPPPADVARPAAPRTTPLDRRWVFTKLGTALAMVGLGACIGAIQYWPVLGYVNVSPRANGREYAFASQFSLPPEELVNTYLPQFSGILDSYWGRNGIHLHSEYMGVFVLMLAPLAFGTGSRRALSRFFLATLVISLLWALGEYTPFFHLVYWVIPGTRYFRAPSTMLFVVTFALCTLATLGFERVLRRFVTPRFALRYAAGWIAFAMLMLVLSYGRVLSTYAHFIGHDVAIARGFDPAGYALFIDANESIVSLGALRSLGYALVLGALLVAFTRRRLRTAPFATAVLLAAGADFWSIAHRYWMFSEPAAVLYSRDGVIDYLKAQPQPGRVFVYGKTADYRTATDPFYGANGFGMGTGFMVNGIRTTTGYQGNALARYEALAAGNGAINPAFWQHENVRWLYTNTEIADSVLKRLVGPVVNAAGSTSYLYNMPGNNPYSWIASSSRTMSDSLARAEILTATFNPRSLAVFDSSTKIVRPLSGESAATPSTLTTNVTRYGPGTADIELSAPSAVGNVLVVSENYYPGWTATVDGTTVPVVRADYNLLGIQLPTGAKHISLAFEDPRYATGRLVTLLALAVTGVLIVAGAAQRRLTAARTASGATESSAAASNAI